MFVSVSDFRSNMMYYPDISSREDVIITRHSRAVATVTNTADSLSEAVGSLCGVFKVEEAKAGDGACQSGSILTRNW